MLKAKSSLLLLHMILSVGWQLDFSNAELTGKSYLHERYAFLSRTRKE